MAVDGGDEHFIVLRRETRFCYLDALLSAGFYPDFRQLTLVSLALIEHMNVSAVVVCVDRYSHKNEHPKKR